MEVLFCFFLVEEGRAVRLLWAFPGADVGCKCCTYPPACSHGGCDRDGHL